MIGGVEEISREEQVAAGVTDFCGQCYRDRPLSDFIGPSGRFVKRCADCRDRYGRWATMTPEERIAARRPVERTGDGYHVAFVLRSMNRKTGPIPVSTTDMQSCPDSCAHKDAGCYAGYGKAAYHWRMAGEGHTWDRFCERVARLPEGQLWRHNEAGDLPGRGDRLDVRALDKLVKANRGRRGFTFTHKPLRHHELAAVRRANREGFRINLSADSLEEADDFADLGLPVAVILPAAVRKSTKTPAGRTVVVCPAVTHGLTCAQCGLCAKDRKAIVGFPAHGQGASFVELRIRR